MVKTFYSEKVMKKTLFSKYTPKNAKIKRKTGVSDKNGTEDGPDREKTSFPGNRLPPARTGHGTTFPSAELPRCSREPEPARDFCIPDGVSG
jgi:hypothetical protein